MPRRPTLGTQTRCEVPVAIFEQADPLERSPNKSLVTISYKSSTGHVFALKILFILPPRLTVRQSRVATAKTVFENNINYTTTTCCWPRVRVRVCVRVVRVQ